MTENLFKGMASAGVITALLLPMTSQAVMIDTFDDLQFTADELGSPGATTASAAAAGAIGGEREQQVETTSAGAQFGPRTSFFSGNSGELGSHSQDSGVEGYSFITWDGVDGAPGLAYGLGGVDFTSANGDGTGGVQTGLNMQIASNDIAGEVTVFLFTSATEWSFLTLTSPANIPPDPEAALEFAFDDFIIGSTVPSLANGSALSNLPGAASSAADLTNINAVGLLLDGSNVENFDISVRFFETTVVDTPTPFSAALLAGGLGLLGWGQRRRRKTA